MSKFRCYDLPGKSTTTLYSDCIIFGDTLIISGLLARDENSQLVGKNDIKVQAEQVFQNIKLALDIAGIGFADVVKLTIFVTDINYLKEFSSIRKKYFGEYKPASTAVEISRLALPDALLEIEVMAQL